MIRTELSIAGWIAMKSAADIQDPNGHTVFECV